MVIDARVEKRFTLLVNKIINNDFRNSIKGMFLMASIDATYEEKRLFLLKFYSNYRLTEIDISNEPKHYFDFLQYMSWHDLEIYFAKSFYK